MDEVATATTLRKKSVQCTPSVSNLPTLALSPKLFPKICQCFLPMINVTDPVIHIIVTLVCVLVFFLYSLPLSSSLGRCYLQRRTPLTLTVAWQLCLAPLQSRLSGHPHPLHFRETSLWILFSKGRSAFSVCLQDLCISPVSFLQQFVVSHATVNLSSSVRVTGLCGRAGGCLVLWLLVKDPAEEQFCCRSLMFVQTFFRKKFWYLHMSEHQLI